ncbi:hypothetical protein PYS58_06615 [Chryseobacterium indologenes]|uniref:DUF6602 domain-containing protein n=1 Tax=Chryseobacterium indologenes TaxID=253 RepID=UPI0011098326|nr:DUF6602 domain-containing protein [Chryseobacterium indologenes]TLX26632.1 hypothetical protein FE904_07205 [Chryseobacterium indologenes]WET50800.1 hypothetical protein PYS58_06615 [Chryseobacterium indologenes]
MAQNAVIGSLLENLDAIEIIFKPTYEPFNNDRGNTGDSKEYSVQEFIASYLTSEYRIEKGCIYSQNAHSNNIDCVILSPNHPRLTTPKRNVILAEGVYAAVEVKPDISDKTEFARGLNQIKSIKSLERKTYVPELTFLKTEATPEFVKKIPSIIFSNKSLTTSNTIEFIQEKIANGELTIYDLPDMILTLDNGLYVMSPDIKTSLFGNWFLENTPDSEGVNLLHFCDTQKSETLALFIFHLLNVPSAVLKQTEFILNEYLKDYNNIMICGYKLNSV